MTLDDLNDATARLLDDLGVDTSSWTPAQYAKAANYACLECVKRLGLTSVEAPLPVPGGTATAPILQLPDDLIEVLFVSN